MKKISLEHRQLLESQGFHVMDIPYDGLHKTTMMCQHPDGKTLYLYPDWYSVPYDQMINGQEYDVAVSPNVYYPNNFNYYFDYTQTLNAQTGRLDMFVSLAICLLVVIVLAICVHVISSAIHAPCGTEPKILEISECEKVITKPDCSVATFNQCYDGDGDGIYEGRYTSGWSGGMNWIWWLVIGAVAIGGIYLAVKIIPGLFEKRGYPVQQFWPRERRAPDIE